MTESTLKRLINSGRGYNIARAWLGYKAISELRLKEAEPPLKVDEGAIMDAVCDLAAAERDAVQKAFDTYDKLRYNNMLAMAQLQHAGRRSEELRRRLDLAWMFGALGAESYTMTNDYNNPAKYALFSYCTPLFEYYDELREYARFAYDGMHRSLNFIKAYNAAVEVAAKYYKIPEISQNWLQYDPTDEIVKEYNKSRGRIIRLYAEQLPSHNAKRALTTIRECFSEIKFGLIDVPNYKIKEGAEQFAATSASISDVISLFHSFI